MGFIAVSQFAFLHSVFANFVSPPPLFFLLFLLQLMQPNWNDIMLSGSRAWIRTHKALQENQGPTAGGVSAWQEDEMFIRWEENLANSLYRWSFLQKHVDWNVENIRSVLTWWWGEIEDRQMGWEGFDERGPGEEAINKSGWKKRGDIKHWHRL